MADDDTMGSQENGQEEWLSESGLTDDEYDAVEAGQNEDQLDLGHDDSTVFSGNEMSGETTHLGHSMEQDVTMDEDIKQEDSVHQTVEATLQQLSESREESRARLNDVTNYMKRESGGEGAEDGNNTDELLQMLGDDKPRKKKQVLKTVSERQAQATKREPASSDDEDDSLEAMVVKGARVTRLRVAQSVLGRGVPAKKAKPEALSDSEMSTDEDETAKKTSKPGRANTSKQPQTQAPEMRNSKSLLRAVRKENLVKPAGLVKSISTSTPLKQYPTRSAPKKEQAPKVEQTPKKDAAPKKEQAPKKDQAPKKEQAPKKDPAPKRDQAPKKEQVAYKSQATKKEQPTKKVQETKKEQAAKTTQVTKKNQGPKKGAQAQQKDSVKKPVSTPGAERAPIAKEVFEIEEEYDDEPEPRSQRSQPQSQSQQRLMRPESMEEEEYLSEDESEMDEDDCSFYDELPTSDCEEIGEWFALDIRAERAGDYIPLLGDKAFELLSEERDRVADKLRELRGGLTDVAQRGRQQGGKIEAARRTLAELETVLAYA